MRKVTSRGARARAEAQKPSETNAIKRRYGETPAIDKTVRTMAKIATTAALPATCS